MTDVAPSWNGPIAVATCRTCGSRTNVADRGGDTHEGHCPTCEAHRTFDYWRGPVEVV